ncbi:MAG TPA: DUF433 domain-containing protein [Gaiellaceae bacterium]|nr:DUF433 domain-containing protein [Gaiellaceae bacterium]
MCVFDSFPWKPHRPQVPRLLPRGCPSRYTLIASTLPTEAAGGRLDRLALPGHRPFQPTWVGSTIGGRRRGGVKVRNGDTRFTAPLYTSAEAARFLGVPTSTLSTWAKGYVRRPPGRSEVRGARIITSVEAPRNYPTIPFIGLGEAMVLAAFRKAGVSLQHIRQAVRILDREIGVNHALASRRVYTDGAVILFDYADATDDEELAGLTEVVRRQRVFAPVVREYLKKIDYAADGWAARLVSPATPRPIVIVDPRRAFGQPIFIHGASRVEDVIDRWKAGDRLVEVAEDFGVPTEDVEDILRVALPAAA